MTISCAAWRTFSGTREGRRRGARAVRKSDRARSRLRVGLRHGRVVPLWRRINGWTADPPERPPKARGWRAAPSTRPGRRGRARARRPCARPFHPRPRCRDRLPGQGAGAQSKSRGGVVPGRIFVNLAGRARQAIECFEHAMRLSPLDPEIYRMPAGWRWRICFRAAFRRRLCMGGESVLRCATLPAGRRRRRGELCAGRPPGEARRAMDARSSLGALRRSAGQRMARRDDADRHQEARQIPERFLRP